MTDYTPALRIIEATGPTGAIIIALMIGFVIAFLMMWQGSRMLSGNTVQQQATEFQDRLIKALEAMTKSEAASRETVRSLMVENQALRSTVSDLTASVDLLRAQMRRMFGILRDIQSGKIAAATVDTTGFDGDE